MPYTHFDENVFHWEMKCIRMYCTIERDTIKHVNVSKWSLQGYTPEGISSVANFITAYEESQ